MTYQAHKIPVEKLVVVLSKQSDGAYAVLSRDRTSGDVTLGKGDPPRSTLVVHLNETVRGATTEEKVAYWEQTRDDRALFQFDAGPFD